MSTGLTEIDHIAIAVNDLDAAVDYYRATYGVEPVHREVVDKDGVEEVLLKVADSYIQLLTPVRDDSPVAKYLEKKGEGLHHVGYRVDDCAAALERVKAEATRSSTRRRVRGAVGPRWRSCTRRRPSARSSSSSRSERTARRRAAAAARRAVAGVLRVG